MRKVSIDCNREFLAIVGTLISVPPSLSNFYPLSKMASSVANTIRSVGETVANTTSAMVDNKKIADLQKNIKDSHSKQNTTTDYGAKVPDVDHWLKIVDEKGDKIGPHLLEDHIGRERVCSTASNPTCEPYTETLY